MNTLVTTLFLAATVSCASNQPAPGTSPGDMSPEEHRAEAAQHDEESAEHQHDAHTAPGKDVQKHNHRRKASEHADVADQHEAAADEAENAE